jgi:hypothetical protein
MWTLRVTIISPRVIIMIVHVYIFIILTKNTIYSEERCRSPHEIMGKAFY